MFQLYKQRNFGALISDTFNFFKVHGKNYLKSYFIINGAILLVISLLVFLLTKFFIDSVTRPMMDGGLLFITGTAVVTLIVFLSMLSYSIPVLYLRAIQDKREPETKEIVNLLKANLGKIILFLIASLISFVPLLFLVSLVTTVLSGLILGLLGIFGSILGIVIFAVMGSFAASWVFLSFYDNITSKNGFFTSLGNGFTMVLNGFWKNIGATAVIGIIILAINFCISVLPGLIGTFTLLNETTPEGLAGGINVFTVILMIVNVLISYTLVNLILITQGMIYYSNEEEKGNNSLHSEIDLIGGESE